MGSVSGKLGCVVCPFWTKSSQMFHEKLGLECSKGPMKQVREVTVESSKGRGQSKMTQEDEFQQDRKELDLEIADASDRWHIWR